MIATIAFYSIGIAAFFLFYKTVKKMSKSSDTCTGCSLKKSCKAKTATKCVLKNKKNK